MTSDYTKDIIIHKYQAGCMFRIVLKKTTFLWQNTILLLNIITIEDDTPLSLILKLFDAIFVVPLDFYSKIGLILGDFDSLSLNFFPASILLGSANSNTSLALDLKLRVDAKEIPDPILVILPSFS